MRSPNVNRIFTTHTVHVAVAALLLVAACPGHAQSQSRRIQLEDLRKIMSLSDPQISPDGKSVAFVVSRVNWEEDRRDSTLLLLDIATGAQHPLTFDRRSLSSPRWSPQGDALAFLAAAGPEKDAKEQIFVLPIGGGEARKLTDAALGVEQYAWRPGGKAIAYATPDEPANKKEIEKHNDAFEVGDNDYLATEAPTPSHIWLITLDDAKAKRLTSGAWSLSKSAPPSPPSSLLSWSPDGKYICVTRQDDPHYGDNDKTTIRILDVASGDIRKTTQHAALENLGIYSPDGTHIAYWYPRDGDPNNENEIFVAPAVGGDGADRTREIDRNLFGPAWTRDSRAMLVGGNNGTRVSLWLQPLDGPAKPLDLGDVEPSVPDALAASMGPGNAIAFIGSTPNHPAELYYMDSPGAKPRRLTDFNKEIASLSLGPAEGFDWQGPNGFKEDGVVYFPPDFQKDKKYPLVLQIHGGPQAASTLGFNFFDQLIASHGYIVFCPNYRGSDNLGNAYQHAIANDAGDGPGRDVMAGVSALEKRRFVDESRIAVSGWSYGGYMTSWLIGHYHIWKVAVAGAAVNNKIVSYNLSDFNVTERFDMPGSPWVGDNMKAYLEQSPITYAAQIRTPTLILSDTGDARVPIADSYEMYHALKDNGVAVKFIAYPVAGHFPNDPVRASDVMHRWLDWLDQYLK